MSRKCAVCAKTTYPMETTTYDSKDYHNTCFRCKSCDCRLNPATTQNIGGEVYCKGCYARIFKSSGGNYAAFGAQHLPKTAPVSVRDMEAARSASSTGTEPVSPQAQEQVVASPKAEEKTVLKEKEEEVKPEEVVEETKPEEDASKTVEAVKPIEDAPKAVEEEPKKEEPKQEEPKKEEPKQEEPKKEEPKEVTKPAVVSPTSAEPARPRASSSFPVFGGANTCRVCEKKVYVNDEVKFDDQSYHKTCFKCKTCSNTLSLGRICNFEKDLYCSNCFKRSFREGGGQYNTIGNNAQ